jgi:hypothetical protein
MTTSVIARVVQYTAIGALSIATAHAQSKPVNVPTNPLKNAYFGELHTHTGMSFDAFLIGSQLYPDTAYRFARGEEIEHDGQKFRRKVPLDFLAVTDHAEYLGQMRLAADPKGPLAGTRWAKLIGNSTPSTRRGRKHCGVISSTNARSAFSRLRFRTIRTSAMG